MLRQLCSSSIKTTRRLKINYQWSNYKHGTAVDKDNVLKPEFKSAVKDQLPLDQELPGLPVLKPASQLQVPTTQASTLDNGLRVISQETYGQAATLGLFVDAGSRYETDSNAGVSHMLEHFSFKSTAKRTHADFVREIEDIGGTVTATSGREQLAYSIDVLRDNIENGLELLADSVMNPSLVESELDAIRNILSIELDMMDEDPHGVVHERIHEAAYGVDSPLGRSRQAPKAAIPHLTGDMVREYMKNYFVARRMVLAGAGVEHERLVELANRFFKDLAPGVERNSSTTERAEYKGGEVRMNHPDSELSYAALAFETCGWHGDDLVPVCVLQTLLGGGDSFSAGGPGKGMYSRLYTSVLNRYYWVESATAFTSIHKDTGLLGIYGAAMPQHSSNLIAILCNQFLRLVSEPVAPIELSRAKNQLKSSVLMNLESRMILYEDIGRQILTYGRRESPESICAKIDAVTEQDIMRLARTALTSEPSLVCYGNVALFPTHDQVQAALKDGLAVGRTL